MDETAEAFTLMETGFCNYCTDFLQTVNDLDNLQGPYFSGDQLSKLIKKVKKTGIGKEYDCVVGVSGGVDSSYVLHRCLELGLRPLAVHMDNAWDAEAAQFNIEMLLRNTGVPLETYVIDWEVYKAMMQKFFDSDVVDVELLYDNAAIAVQYYYARKYNIKYIFSGSNKATEGIRIPNNWNWFKLDRLNIAAIARGVQRKNFPTIGVFKYIYYRKICRIETIDYLDYIKYNKEDSLNLLEKFYAYKRYPYKHYESVFTRLYQGYLLPQKFKIDKRKVHLSTLILTRQLTRKEALLKLSENPYPDPDTLRLDIKFFMSKMGWSETDLQNYLLRPSKSHTCFRSEKKVLDLMLYVNSLIRKVI